MADIDLTFSFEITVSVEVSVEVEVEYEAEYGVTEIIIDEEEGDDDLDFDASAEINVDGWESWGSDVIVPARGWYAQFGQKNAVDFYNFKRYEDNILRGAGSDGVGEFDIYGQLDGKFFQFVKQYRGAHYVVYNGKLKKGIMTGTWEIPDNCDGTFNIQTGWQKWKGKYYQFDDGQHMKFDEMYIGDTGVIGHGNDGVGEFFINGYKDGDQVWFCKAYVGQHQVYYQGTLDGRKLKGRWEIPGNCDGKFKIKCKRELW